MKNHSLTECFLKTFYTIILLAWYAIAAAQVNLPQQPFTVDAVQAINFGSFCITGKGGGSITVSYDGSRTSTGDITLLATYPIALPAVFEYKLCPGKHVSINFDANAIIPGRNGISLKMDVGPSDKGPNGFVFTTTTECNALTTLRVGGTLHIPGNAKPGNYSGLFNVTLNLE